MTLRYSSLLSVWVDPSAEHSFETTPRITTPTASTAMCRWDKEVHLPTNRKDSVLCIGGDLNSEITTKDIVFGRVTSCVGVIKEGGKKNEEIEGAADMGGA